MDKLAVICVLFVLLGTAVTGVSDVRHTVDNNILTITYDGTPPFLINIRNDVNIGENGGYVWAKTYAKSVSFDLGSAAVLSGMFYYGIKDKVWSETMSVSQNVTNCSSEIIILKESELREFLIPPGECYDGVCNNGDGDGNNYTWFMSDNFLRRFYETHQDTYDFLVVFPQSHIRNAYFLPVNRDIKGIGTDYIQTSPYTSRLEGIATMADYGAYTFALSAGSTLTVDDNYKKTFIHEVAHNWCCYAQGINGALPAHWTYNLDLFAGDTDKIDPMGYAQWILKNDSEYCVDQTNTPVFSNMTLYLMGLLEKESVAPISVHEFSPKEGDDHYNLWGPMCEEDHEFTSTRKVTIDDIIQANGPRSPAQEQRQYRIGIVVPVAYDDEVDDTFVEYLTPYSQDIPALWRSATRNLSTLNICN